MEPTPKFEPPGKALPEETWENIEYTKGEVDRYIKRSPRSLRRFLLARVKQ